MKDLIYRNYKMYNDRGRRLSIFAKSVGTSGITNPKVEFCVYECSLEDNFSKKKAYEHYMNGGTDIKSNCFVEDIKFDLPNISRVIEKKFYKRDLITMSVLTPIYTRKKSKKQVSFFFLKKNGKATSKLPTNYV